MLPASILVLGLLPTTVTGSGEPARLQLSLAAEAFLMEREADPVLRLDATVFFTRVVDDATPVPLQPYLQRASSLSLHLAGARHSVSGGWLAGSLELAADVYLARVFAMTAAVGGNAIRDSFFESKDPLPSPFYAAAAMAVRLGDLRIDVGYRYMPRAATVPSWFLGQRLPAGAPLRDGGGITLGVLAVLVERIALRLNLAISLAGDLYGSFRSDYYPSRRLGLLWGIDFAHGPFGVTRDLLPFGQEGIHPVFDRFGALVGLSWWWTRRLGVAGKFAMFWDFPTDPTDATVQRGRVGQLLTLELSTRI